MSKILLIFPPSWDLYLPYPSLPALSAFLRMKGITVDVWDANVELYDRMISDTFLKQALERLENQISSVSRNSPRFSMLVKKIQLGKWMYGKVDEIKNRLRSFHADHEIICQGTNITENMKFISGLDVWPSYENTVKSLSSLEKSASDTAHNPFYPWIEEMLEKKIAGLEGKAVGISIAGPSQLVHGFVMARWIKAKRPDISIIVGGAFVPYLKKVLLDRPKYPEIDFLVTGEGETALYRLLLALEEKSKWDSIPNLIYPDDSGKYRLSETLYMENMDELPVPDYDDLPLNKYFMEPGMISYVTARGCYWNRCTFCSLSCNYGHRYHARNLDKVLADFVELKRKYDIRHLFLNDEAFPPARLYDLSTKMMEAKLQVQWLALLRAEESISQKHLQHAYDAGLRSISFGLESGAPETLELMHKGIKVKNIARLLKESHDVGIANHVFIMTCFPKDRHIEKTIEFVKNNSAHIDSLTCAAFSLELYSYVYQHPDEFDIVLEKMPDDYFGPEYPFCEAGKNPSEHFQDYRSFLQECNNLPCNASRFFGFQKIRFLFCTSHTERKTIRESIEDKLRMEQEIVKICSEERDFSVKKCPSVLLSEPEPGIVLAYNTSTSQVVMNETVCVLLRQASDTILLSQVCEHIEKIYNADISSIQKDLRALIPQLAVSKFLEVSLSTQP